MSDQPAALLSPASAVRRPWLWVAALILYGLALNLIFIGSSPLGSHEALAAERAREMVTLGHWTVPHLDGVPDVRKPPLPFVFTGLLAAAGGGFTETTVRAPSALAALGVALLLMFWVRRWLGWCPALLTAFVTLTSAGFIGWGRRGEVDMQVAFWTAATMLSYWLVVTETGFARRAAWFAIMSLSLAAGVLTKGPLTPATLVVTSLALAIAGDPDRRGWRALWPMIFGGFASIALVAPWVLAMVHAQPDAWEVWYREYIGRAGGVIGHDKPWHFYLTRTPLQLWGLWTVFVILGAYLAIREHGLPRWFKVFLIIWGSGVGLILVSWLIGHFWLKLVVPWGTIGILWGFVAMCGLIAAIRGQGWLVFLLAWGLGAKLILSFSVGKRIHYAMGAQPPFLFLAGWALDRVISAPPGDLLRRFRRPVAWGVAVYAVLALVGVGVYTGVFLARPDPAENQSVVGRYIASDLRAADTVASYRGVGAVEVFYAHRFIPVVEQNDLAVWRKQHPGGYLIVGRDQIPELRSSQGPWPVIFPPCWQSDSKSQTVLLRVPPN